ncbi:MAG: DUF4302 domain-containing protein [Cyclobacteriaceae bacterium]
MKKLLIYIGFVATSMAFFSCTKEEVIDLPTVEERFTKSRDSLVNALVAPEFGWRINYQPDQSSGSFVILMTFDEEGNVNIKSDVTDNDGEFLDSNITYRIDNAHGLELILENYGIFHYFFERFNGEFEFIFVNYQENNLVFRSKSDFSNQTVLNFEPAAEGDEELLTNEISQNLKKSVFQDAQLIGNNAYFQLYLIDKDISVFITLDLDLRTCKILNAAVGETIDEITTNNNTVDVFHKTNYLVQGEKIIFNSAFSFSLNGQDILISELELFDFVEFQDSFCEGQTLNLGKFQGKIGNENITFSSTLYSAGSTFSPQSNSPYGVSSVGFFDQNDETLQDLIAQTFPDIAAIQFYFNFTLNSGDLNAFGFVVLDNNNNADFFLREFTAPTFEGNRMRFTFTGETLITKDNPTPEEEQGLIDLTDLLFGSGEVYVLEFAGDDTLFEIYNACNNHKLFLFQ